MSKIDGDLMVYDDGDLEQLIACQKRVTDPPRKAMKIEGKHKRNVSQHFPNLIQGVLFGEGDSP